MDKIREYINLRQYGFTVEQLRQALEVSPKLLEKAEKYLYWEDRLFMTLYIGDCTPIYMLLMYIVYSCLWIATWIVTWISNHWFKITLIEGIVWIDLIWIYGIVTIVIIYAGNRAYSYCRKQRDELCKIIEKLVNADLR